MFAAAVQRHQAGQLLEAEQLYRQVLAGDKKHADSLHNLGLVNLQIGRPDVGVELIAQAVAINARMPEWHYNLAYALTAVQRPREAIEHYRKAVAMRPGYVEALTNLGNVLKTVGEREQAIASYRAVISLHPNSVEAYYNVANVLAEQERWDEAATAYERALAIKPDFAEAHTNFGIVLEAQGRRVEALARHRQALALNPGLVEAHVNLGKALESEGTFKEAIAHYQQAIGLNPNYAQAHNNCGVVLMALGEVDASIAAFRRAVALRPDLSEAHNNLGILQLAKGELAAAAASWQHAITANPDFVEAYNNLARACMAERDIKRALQYLGRALALRETTETKTLYVECLKDVRTLVDAEQLADMMVRALSEPWGRPADIAPFATSLLLSRAALSEAIARALPVWPRRLPLAELPSTDVLARDRLLEALLSYGRIADTGLERFLTMLRAGLLGLAAQAKDEPDPDTLRLLCALATQCFCNDYVFDVTDEEIERATALQAELAGQLAVDATFDLGGISPLRVAAIAAYSPLRALSNAARLLERSWPEPLMAVIEQQVREPTEEQTLRAEIPRLTGIDDAVSLLVQDQYEQNPYPRWIKPAPMTAPTTVDDYLRRQLPLSTFRPLGKGSDIDMVIVGCGTGQHSTEVARRFPGVRLLAVDLSMASLAYAKRQTRRLGVEGITYAQADLLKLGAIGQTFDVIEAAGVVHHLADPREGWRVLSSLLRPGGLIFLALYSELARADVVAGRAFIAAQGYRPVIADIRQCRQQLIDAERGTPLSNLTKSPDFNTTSECRDLLFHAQEHRTSLPEIKAALAENGLAFLGFEIDPFVRRQYAAAFPDDARMIDLDNWHAFETERPLSFARMYQFWAQKQ